MPEISRRQFIAATGFTAASIWLAAETRDLIAAGVHAAQAKHFEVLSDADAADIEAAAAQIIPSDGGTPGAREARVIYFMDKSLATFAKDQRPAFEKGAKELRTRAAKMQRGAKSFAALSNAQQIAVLTAMEKDEKSFFNPLRFGTIAGMLANPEYGGNYNKAGWTMLGFNDQFSWSAPFGWYDRNV
jgi:gluconate 2-dehydrogenase gamma chain